MARNLSRSYSGTFSSLASFRTRALNSSQDSSRLMNSAGSSKRAGRIAIGVEAGTLSVGRRTSEAAVMVTGGVAILARSRVHLESYVENAMVLSSTLNLRPAF